MLISHKAIDRPRTTIVGVLLVIIMALMAAIYIPVQRTPAINKAVVLVTIPYPGAQPVEVEDEVSRKIEDALQSLDKVDYISSLSMRGVSITCIVFLDGVEAKRARDDVAHLVDRVRNELPLGREVQPIINHIDFESTPLMLVNLTGPKGFDERSLKQFAEDVQDELETITGVANTQLFGGREREIHVNVNPDLFVEYGLTVDMIRQALFNFHSELPGGSLNTGQFDFQVRNETKLRGVDDIRKAVVTERDGRLITIDDVAEVRDTYRRLQNTAQLDGQNVAMIIVNKEPNINTLGAAKAVVAKVEELRQRHPDVKFSTSRDISEDISIMFYVLGTSAVGGAMLVLVILLWTMGFRSSILVLMAIPFSTAIGLIFLFAAGIAISNMAIFSFILVLGMVVDGAIIVAENIHRHIERGEPPITAAKTGIDEVGIPVIAADLTTVAAFLPMLLVPGIMGDFMGVMPKVVSVALLGSMMVDHFLIPTLAAHWYRQRTVEPNRSVDRQTRLGTHKSSRIRPNHGRLTRAYAVVLRYCLMHRWVPLACVGLAGVWAAVTFSNIGFVFFPKSDCAQFTINYELPLGYSIEETIRAAEVFTGPLLDLQKTGELTHFVTAVGSSAALASRLENDPANGPEFGQIMVQLISPIQPRRHQEKIIEELRGKIKPWPGMIYRIEEVEEGPPGGADVAVRLSGDDLARLGRLADQIRARLRDVKGLTDLQSDYRPDSPELVVEPRPEVLGLFGLTEADLARAVQTAILGDTTIQLTLDDEDVTLRLQADPNYQDTKQDIERLMLRGPSGRRAAIGQVAKVKRSGGLFAVNRRDFNRTVTVRCNIRPNARNEEKNRDLQADDVFEILREGVLPELGFKPAMTTDTSLAGTLGLGQRQSKAIAFSGRPTTEAEGTRAVFTGENEERDKNVGYLFNSMFVGVVLIFGILAIQFNSFRQTVVVLSTVPLSFIGVIFGMWVMGHPFSLASFIGLICLAGIVVNDAIVLVDFTNQARKRGMKVRHALLEAGVNRLRPVLLTTVTTVGGLLPLFLNWSGGAEFWQPLTGAIIFGLAFATALTLVVIPVCYSLAYNWADRRAGRLPDHNGGDCREIHDLPPAIGEVH